MWKRSGLMARYANFQSLITSHLVNEQIHFKLAKRMRRCLLGIRLKLKSPYKLHWEFLFSPDFIGKWACEMTLGIFHRPTSFVEIFKTFAMWCYKTSLCQVEYFPGTEFHILTGNLRPESLTRSGKFAGFVSFFVRPFSYLQSKTTIWGKYHTMWDCSLHTCNLFIISYFINYALGRRQNVYGKQWVFSFAR